METVPETIWLKVLDYGVTALIAVILLYALYRLFLKVLDALKENSMVNADVTRAVDANTRIVGTLCSTVKAVEQGQVVLGEVRHALDNNTSAVQELQKVVGAMSQSVTTLCALMRMEEKKR